MATQYLNFQTFRLTSPVDQSSPWAEILRECDHIVIVEYHAVERLDERFYGGERLASLPLGNPSNRNHPDVRTLLLEVAAIVETGTVRKMTTDGAETTVDLLGPESKKVARCVSTGGDLRCITVFEAM